MLYQIAANGVLLVHLGFVLYAVLGGLFTLRWKWNPVLHLPTVAWAAWIEWSGGICPLTTLENRLRHLAGEAGYTGDFLHHYLLATLYPEGLTRDMQLLLGASVLVINLAIYLFVGWRRR